MKANRIRKSFVSCFRSLKSKNYRLYFIGQIFSNIGFLMEFIALSWLVYRITNSAFYVGLLMFAGQIMNLIISPLAGVLSDRINRFHIMFYASLLAAISSMFLGIYVVFGYESLAVIFAIQLFSGIIKGVIWPVRSAFVKDLIDKPDQLVNAISLNSSMFNTAKIIGPTLAGILIPLAGEGVCFIINSLSYIAILVSISLMNKKSTVAEVSSNSFIHDLTQGFQHAFSYIPIRNIILFIASIGFFGFSINVVLPIYAKEIIGGKADVYGFLTTFSGVGAIFATFYIASRRNSYGLDKVIAYATLVYSSGFFVLAYTNQISIALIAMVVIGVGQVGLFSSSNAIIQTIADEAKVGRVLSLYFTIFVAASILGNLVTGKITDHLGPQKAIALMGGFNLVCTLVYATQVKAMRKKSLLRYARLNYLPVRKK